MESLRPEEIRYIKEEVCAFWGIATLTTVVKPRIIDTHQYRPVVAVRTSFTVLNRVLLGFLKRTTGLRVGVLLAKPQPRPRHHRICFRWCRVRLTWTIK